MQALILGMLLTAVAAWATVAGRGPLRAARTLVACALIALLPWPLLVPGFYGYALSTMVLGILLVGRGRPVGLALVLAGLLLPAFNTESDSAIAAVPVGLAWIVFAIGMWRSGWPEPATPASVATGAGG